MKYNTITVKLNFIIKNKRAVKFEMNVFSSYNKHCVQLKSREIFMSTWEFLALLTKDSEGAMAEMVIYSLLVKQPRVFKVKL